MQTYHVKLESEIFNTYRCQMAANSCDIDVKKKSIHELLIQADLNNKFNLGIILGASGSGKTTLAKKIFGDNCFDNILDLEKPIIDQFPEHFKYEDCATILSGMGLTSVPCWIRPAKTLSNGQRARAEAALLLSQDKEIFCIDEWTSVVDRTVAKAMSNCIQKMARKINKKIILLSCHYDVIEWLDPDWIIDCNTSQFIDRRSLPQDARKRTEQLKFTVGETTRSTWKQFSKYHYLSEKLPPGQSYYYGLFHENSQIGFLAFTNYMPIRKGSAPIFHLHRIVVHPDYLGLGLGIKFSNTACELFKKKRRFVKIFIKLSSKSMFYSLKKSKNWTLKDSSINYGLKKTKIGGVENRRNVKTYSFAYIA